MNYKAKNRLNPEEYIEGILQGNRVILSRAITIVESSLKQDKLIAQEIVKQLIPHSGNSIRIGITGVPGVGKSTFIESFGKFLIGKGHRVAVLSIDPSSRKTKGSILGDKTRMEDLANLDAAFIRPSASGETLGGVANKTAESIVLCEAAGYDVVLVETVGVGQSETAVHSMTDFFLLLMLAGAGDELQGIKKGIMEMADMVLVNKADGDNLVNSKRAAQQYQNALHIFPQQESGWTPVVDVCSAIESQGIERAWSQIEKFIQTVKANNYFFQNRNNQKIRSLYDNLDALIKSSFYENADVAEMIDCEVEKISSSKISPISAAQKIFESYLEKQKNSH